MSFTNETSAGFFSSPPPPQKKTIVLGICPNVSPLMYISKFHTAKIINFLQGNATDRRYQMIEHIYCISAIHIR